MSIRRPAILPVLAGYVAAGAILATVTAARADELQVCATQYQQAKADNKLNGQAWQDFYPDCKAKLASGAPAKSETPETAAAPAEKAPEPKNEAPAPAAAASPAAAPAAQAQVTPAKAEEPAAKAHAKKGKKKSH